jgi:hypothetical protein
LERNARVEKTEKHVLLEGDKSCSNVGSQRLKFQKQARWDENAGLKGDEMMKDVGFERGHTVKKRTISGLFLAVLGRKTAVLIPIHSRF